MRQGGPPAEAIAMTERQKKLLKQLSKEHSTPQQIAVRARVLLLASDGVSNSEIKRVLKIARNTVTLWRNRWLSTLNSLLEFEKGIEAEGISDKRLKQHLISILRDNKRSGAPKTFTLSQRNLLIALACEKPIDHGLEMTDWTHEMLAKIAITKGIVKTISPSHLGKILKK
jgi:DNA-binding CsgD family transcriptional regulator